jgi:hypothetical protein
MNKNGGMTLAQVQQMMTANGGWVSPAPANSSSTGTTGQFSANTSYLYICIATNTWRRVAVESF